MIIESDWLLKFILINILIKIGKLQLMKKLMVM